MQVEEQLDKDTVLLLNEHVITGRDDPMPPNQVFWNNAGIEANVADKSWFVSNFTS